ncbi:MAG: FAD-dependent oxidoreductase [Firmicutes bacterium]|nr:FAD-dependent oxidoreductase [Bacillota bacterium]
MRVDNSYDVVVVGGGIAGLTSTAYLSKNGYNTLLLEKASKLGGLVNSFDYKGFTYDGGIRAFENSGIVFPMLKQLGINIDFVKNPVSIGIEDKFVKLINSDSLEDYHYLLNEKFPEDVEGISNIINEIKKVMKYMDVLYGLDNPLFVNYMEDKEYIFKTLLPWLFKYQINIRKVKKLNEPINEYLSRFTKNKALIDMITQHFFKNTPTFFALSYFGLYLDYSYPIGGTGVLVKKIADFIKDKDGKIETKTQVVEVDVKKKEVTTSDGRKFRYKKLIWCADMTTLYSSIIVDDLNNIKEQKNIIQSNEGCDSLLTIFMSVNLDSDYFAKITGCHSFYTPNKIGLRNVKNTEYEKILNDKQLNDSEKKSSLKNWVADYLSLTTYEISIPSIRDISLSPIGQTGLIISTLFDYKLIKYIFDIGWYEEFKAFVEDKIIGVLKDSIFPELSDNILDIQCSTPLTLEKLTGNLGGAITGWAFLNKKLPAETRFPQIAQSIKTPIPDVFQAGQWTFSPSGMPVSILTGKLASDAVMDDLKKGK